jgi:hypothetical protein
MDIAERNGSALRRRLRSAERFSERAVVVDYMVCKFRFLVHGHLRLYYPAGRGCVKPAPFHEPLKLRALFGRDDYDARHLLVQAVLDEERCVDHDESARVFLACALDLLAYHLSYRRMRYLV